MLRQQVLQLYRDFIKLIRTLDDENERKELRDWIRNDFKSNKHHTDEVSKLQIPDFYFITFNVINPINVIN